MNLFRGFALVLYVLVLIVLTTIGVGLAGERGFLIPAAVPMALVIVFALRFLPPRFELAAWSMFTVWLGLTYVQGGGPLELGVLAFYVLVALLGFWRSPWLLALGWLLHVPWDFVPRELPAALVDLPVACILFDWIVAGYLAWSAHRKRFARPE